ncbi:hypothetical protein [Streptomyces sp. NPDC057382]|uniref:hypothetical protein n=1 Tax=unclassified Streptomyces TaxID=2593676 RepID=UPI003634F4AA
MDQLTTDTTGTDIDVGVTGSGPGDRAAAARRARFGSLPARIRTEDLVEERPAAPNDPARYGHDPEASWRVFACLAADLGL